MELFFIILPTFIHAWLMGDLTRTDEDQAMKIFGEGIILFESGQIAQSFRYFKSKEIQNPKSAILYYYLGRCHFEFENYEAALKDFDKALRLDTTIRDFYFYKAMCHYYLEDWQAAKFQLKKASRFYFDKNEELNLRLLEVDQLNIQTSSVNAV
jgi:tetratricopeptide (TPR) repeat protein